jgi:hypothetical protein
MGDGGHNRISVLIPDGLPMGLDGRHGFTRHRSSPQGHCGEYEQEPAVFVYVQAAAGGVVTVSSPVPYPSGH